MTSLLQNFQWFIDQGGSVLWAIFGTCFLLWFLILERFWFLRVIYPKRLAEASLRWRSTLIDNPWVDRSLRKATISELKIQLSQNISLIQTLIVLCPLLGLLGTVTGMVNVFEVIAVVGTSDAQAMAQGVYRATIPTMAGLVVSLSGLYFSSRLRHQVSSQSDQLTDRLMQV